MDSKELFTRKSEDYALFRPSYPAAAVEWLAEKTSAVTVADIGAGTGIFTACLAKRFKEVTGIEPNEEMRSRFMTALPQIPCLAGSGEASGLPERSVDLITVAQAFHWLDEEKFKAEACRILRHGGKVAIIWNTSVKDEFVLSRDEICKKYCPGFRKGHAGKRTPAEGDAFLRCSYFKEVEFVSFPNPFVMNREVFAGNIRSRSYALTADHQDFPSFQQELESVFEKYAVNGCVTENQETQIFLGSF